MLEVNQDVFKCKLCNSYNILKKSGTEYCNNLSQFSDIQTCSEYAKNEKLKNDENKDIKKEEKRKKDREKARVRNNPYYPDEKRKDCYNKIDEQMRKKKIKYENGKINKNEYLDWLKNIDIIT